MSDKITLTITTDQHRAHLIIAILAIWNAYDGRGLIELYDKWEDLQLASLALWDVAWSVWGDEGMMDDEMFKNLSKGQDRYEIRQVWNMRKLCYMNVPDEPPTE